MSHWITRSNPASSRLMITTTSITTQVSCIASWRVGQTTLRSSKRASDRKPRVWWPLALVRKTTSAAATPATTARTRSGVGHWPSNQ